MASSSRARPAEGFYVDLFEDLVDVDDDSDDDLDPFSDSSDDEYVVDEGEGANEPLPDRQSVKLIVFMCFHAMINLLPLR